MAAPADTDSQWDAHVLLGRQEEEAPGTAQSAEIAWQLGEVSSSKEAAFRDKVEEAIANICQQWGGPQQYLIQRYGTKETLTEFSQQLWKMFPPADSDVYSFMQPLPSHKPAEVNNNSNLQLLTIHLSLFGFMPDHSPKEMTKAGM